MFSRKEKVYQPTADLHVSDSSNTFKVYVLGVLTSLVLFTLVYMFLNREALIQATNLFLFHRSILTNEKVMKNLKENTFAIENLDVVIEIEGAKK